MTDRKIDTETEITIEKIEDDQFNNRELLTNFVEFLESKELDQGPEWCEDVLSLLPEFLKEYGVPYTIREMRKSAFQNYIVQGTPEVLTVDDLLGPADQKIVVPDGWVELREDTTLLLVGKRGNVWSDMAEMLLEEAACHYMFETISTPPHPNPANCPGADPDIRAIPTLLRDYDTVDSSGDEHHIRTVLAWGIEEVEKWVEAQELPNSDV